MAAPRSLARIALVILAAVSAGAVANTLVAWFVMSAKLQGAPLAHGMVGWTHEDGHYIVLMFDVSATGVEGGYQDMFNPGVRDVKSMLEYSQRTLPNSEGAYRDQAIAELTTWGPVGEAWIAGQAAWIADQHPRVEIVRQYAFGWPWRSMGEWKLECADQTSPVGYAVQIPWLARTLGVDSRIPGFPLRPLWPGFALNTIFYAALAWGIWQVPLAICSVRRRRNGKCVRCGYDLTGLTAPDSPCPECGATSKSV